MDKNRAVTNHFKQINIAQGKIFVLIIGLLCMVLFAIIDPLVFDLSVIVNKYLWYSHLIAFLISTISVLLIQYGSSKKIKIYTLTIYTFLLSFIQSGISGAFDVPLNRGPSLFIMSIFFICFLFYHPKAIALLFILSNYFIFAVTIYYFHTEHDQLIYGLGSGSVFTIIVLFMKIYVDNHRAREYKKQLHIIEYIKSKKKNSIASQFIVDEKHLELSKKFKKYVIEEQRYLKTDLTLAKVAESTGTNSTYLSQCINQYYAKNFNALINEYRIEESLKLINHKLSKVVTIEAIAEQVGFKSKSAFYAAFKAKTGMTPTEYLKKKPK